MRPTEAVAIILMALGVFASIVALATQGRNTSTASVVFLAVGAVLFGVGSVMSMACL